ncbi:MAG: Flp pilus assembly complex ATPase component TadA [Caldisphaeraceae archaeon]|nr:Flp pilus assembly complex ATPase component TadA [Caldisphaeraceae archaeon]MEB3691572.1 ATPase, T2SS/T4P/T4SS family [Caldisphaeraceae archaeon]MEB3797616.1 Flp pilus assembly complex ATPase component TadA [Caldisphaeraceae archaeon]
MNIKLNILKRGKKEIKEVKIPDFGERPAYLENYMKSLENPPTYIRRPEASMRKLREFNFVYPVGGGVFIHVLSVKGSDMGKYIVIEPPKPPEELMRLIDIGLADQIEGEAPDDAEERKKILLRLIDNILVPSEKEVDYKSMQNTFYIKKIYVKKDMIDYVKYHVIRNKIGVGILEPFLRDPYLEDISLSGVGPIYVVHKIFNRLASNLGFNTQDELDSFVLRLGEKIGKPISRARPIVDASLPDGSRLNIVFGSDVSLNGTNFTIRKFSKIPISITQLIDWGTIDERIAGYIWMLIRDGMSGFICGETASGKTTALNAIATFIKPTHKIVTIEDTAEIQLPHPNWTRELARDTGRPETSVTLFDLLKAALRQRPDYIIVGEIRGAEGAIAFQAMQCIKEGHVVLGDDIKNIKDVFEYYKNKYGTKIVSNKEIIQIKDRNLKIPAYNNDGIKSTNVIAIAKMPKEKLIRIVLDDGNVFEVTKNHKFITNLGELSSQSIFKLFKTNKDVYIKRIKNFENKLPKNIKFRKATLKLSSPLFWYLVGLVLGNKELKCIDDYFFLESEIVLDREHSKGLPIKEARKNGSKPIGFRRGYILEPYFVDWLIKNGFIYVDKNLNLIKKIPMLKSEVIKPFLIGLMEASSDIIGNKIVMRMDKTISNNDLGRIIKMINIISKKPEGVYLNNKVDSQNPHIVNKSDIEVVKEGNEKRLIIKGVLFHIFHKILKEKRVVLNRKINASYKDIELDYIKVRKDKFYRTLKRLWLSGYMFSTDLMKCNYRLIYLDNRDYVKVIGVEEGSFDNSYDLVLDGAHYYIGFNDGYPIPLEDTGHPVMATFHAGDLTRLIQRLTGQPINIPKPYMDNLNFAWFQASTYSKTGLLVRRLISLYELVGYDPNRDQMSAIPIFNWDPSTDKFLFSGKGSSYLLEEKIARMRGLSRKNFGLIYDELQMRARYLRELVNRKIFDYYKVFRAVTFAESVGIESALKRLLEGKVELNE